MKLPTGLVPKAERLLKKSSPTILTCLGAVGVVATAVLAAKATPKAVRLVRAESRINHDGDPNAYTKKEAVMSCWKCYVPAIVAGGSTIACIFGANALNRRQQAALASAYGLVNRAYQDYRRKVKENFGEEAHRDIIRQIAAEQSERPHITCECMSTIVDNGFDNPNEPEHLFYDAFSERYFNATFSQVLQAEYHLNRNFMLGGDVSLNSFYRFLGIETIPGGDEIGWLICDWLNWIDFDHNKAMIDDGLNGEVECYIIEMPVTPGVAKDFDMDA